MTMKQFFSESKSQLEHKIAQKRIQWVLIPRSAPGWFPRWTFGRQHKVSKKAFAYSLWKPGLFQTVVCRVEAALHSRPLCGVPADPADDLCYLSPGHFLIGAPLVSVPEESVLEIRVTRLSRWQLIQQSLQHFWKRWKSSHLQTLMQKRKWKAPNSPLNVGDVEIIKNTNAPPLSWPSGWVTVLFPDGKGISRVTCVSTETGTPTCPLNALIPIPVEQKGLKT